MYFPDGRFTYNQTNATPAGDSQVPSIEPTYLEGFRGAIVLSGHTLMQRTFDNGNQYTVFENRDIGNWSSQQTIRIEGRLQQDALIAMDSNTVVFSFREHRYETDDVNLNTAAYVYLRDRSGVWKFETVLDQHFVDSAADIGISGDTIAISSATDVFVYSRDSVGVSASGDCRPIWNSRMLPLLRTGDSLL